MRYAARLRHAQRRHARWLRRHHRTSGWRMMYQDTRRVQQNAMRWLCLWNRKKARGA